MYLIADELRAIANLGLRFAESQYDRERSERVLAASARLVAALDRRSPDEVLLQFQDNLDHVSPIVGSNAVVFRDGRVLLIRREDDGLWALPGGLADVGETQAEAAERELLEEANVRGGAIQLLGIFDSRLNRSRSKYQVYSAMFLIEALDAQPQAGPETTDVGFFAEGELPDLSGTHRVLVPLAFKLCRGEVPIPYFDRSPETRQRGGPTSHEPS